MPVMALSLIYLATSMILVPYLWSAAYALLLAVRGETYEKALAERRKDLIIRNGTVFDGTGAPGRHLERHAGGGERPLGPDDPLRHRRLGDDPHAQARRRFVPNLVHARRGRRSPRPSPATCSVSCPRKSRGV